MLFMVIERLKNKNARMVGERFRASGRMLPDGVVYHASWMEPDGSRCFQIMEAEKQDLLQAWIIRWSDLVEFEVVPVMTSGEFWAGKGAGGPAPDA